MPTGWSSWGTRGSRGPEARHRESCGAPGTPPRGGGDRGPRKVLKCYLKTHVLEPCLKSWFEGANWKKADEWPAVAAWLLDISEAGKREEWDRWKDLSQEPLQKGFACGFITPIVHCLNPKLPVVNSKVVRTY